MKTRRKPRCPNCDSSGMVRVPHAGSSGTVHCTVCGWAGTVSAVAEYVEGKSEDTIDVTQSWLSLLAPMLELLENPKTNAGIKQLLRDEFARAFRELDTLIAEKKGGTP